MIVSRYLTREIMLTLIAVMVILLLFFLSNQFIRYLTQAATGQLSSGLVFRLVILEIPKFLGLLLPLGLFLAIILSLGQLYANSEMTVLSASGLSPQRLTRIVMTVAFFVACFAAFLSLWLGPRIEADKNYLLKVGRSSVITDGIIPGRFRAMANGKRVIYVEKISHDRMRMKNLFIAETDGSKNTNTPQEWQVTSAHEGYVKVNEKDNSSLFIAENGYRYKGIPGEKALSVIKFKEYGSQLNTLMGRKKIKKTRDTDGIPTSELWPLNNSNPSYASEIQWRVSIPIMTLILALLAIPLSHVTPRAGKYKKLLPAILLLIVYANGVLIARDWVDDGKISPDIGVWWIHILFLGVALGLPAFLRRFRS